MKPLIRMASITILLIGLSSVSVVAKCCLPAPEVEPVEFTKNPEKHGTQTGSLPANMVMKLLGLAIVGVVIASDDS